MGPYDVLDMADEQFERRLAQESGAIRQDISVVRQEMATRHETAALRQEVNALRQDMATRQEMAALRQEMLAGFAQVHQKIADARTEVIKWSFLFWTGQFLTIGGFLLVILRSR